MFGSEYFYGKEVEGPLVDVETCFVRTQVPKDFAKYPHVYFCISYVKKDYWHIIESCLDSKQIVTLEVTPELLDCPELESLKKNDILKIVTRPFTTFNVVKCTMQQSVPDDYKSDSKTPTI